MECICIFARRIFFIKKKNPLPFFLIRRWKCFNWSKWLWRPARENVYIYMIWICLIENNSNVAWILHLKFICFQWLRWWFEVPFERLFVKLFKFFKNEIIIFSENLVYRKELIEIEICCSYQKLRHIKVNIVFKWSLKLHTSAWRGTVDRRGGPEKQRTLTLK